MLNKIFITVTFLLSFSLLQAQSSFVADRTMVVAPDTLLEAPANWFNLDVVTDKVRGVSTEKAYAELLQNKKTKTVIVAIIDSGIDIEHEDLKDKIWTNEDEVAGNGIDDDKNGYIDDVHGWNFIGNANGDMVNYDNLELTRLYVKYKKIYEGKKESDFKGKKLDEFNQYVKLKLEFEKEFAEAEMQYNQINGFYTAYLNADKSVKEYLKKDEYAIEELDSINSEDENLTKSIQILKRMSLMPFSIEDLKSYVEHFEQQTKYNLNVDFDPRSIVGDDYENKSEKFYGNNKVKGPDAFHGTHVAGIIGANRNNELGIKGIASDIKIMVVRTVPNGDERDKDVANSIIYAVDNGAKVINMSFGKAYSPYKSVVDKAVKYAEKKGVLLVHAAGNDNQDNDLVKNFPNKIYSAKKSCTTWIEVGASSWVDTDEFIGGFSNYGKENVDIFAPGVDIFSSTPENNYKNANGTSMASPVVAGVAALVLSYYPDLTAAQLKDILLKSAVIYKDVLVNIPGQKEKKTEFKNLCITGGIVNAYNALKLAEEISKK
ncbi:MAG: S8 family peptidase [Bacteroidales bacterium]|nr:S8 family peptidase [Bacteroidales bacterium]MBN2756801.1 S8 family peptidase [Bacteroidales bacterium]